MATDRVNQAEASAGVDGSVVVCRDASERLRRILANEQREVHVAAPVDRSVDWSEWGGRVAKFAALAATYYVLSLSPAFAKAQAPQALPDPVELAAVTQVLPPVTIKMGKVEMSALHPMERVRLCMEAAQRGGLAKVGRTWQDVYAIVHAETNWVSRDGMGKNGRVSQGLGQLEGPTAKALGITDPNDPRQAVQAIAALIKDATYWARAKGVSLKDAAISVYYNTSTARRNEWSGHDVSELPFETQRHIVNVNDGKRQAQMLAKQYAKFAPQAMERYRQQMVEQEQERARQAQAQSAQVLARQQAQARAQAIRRDGVLPLVAQTARSALTEVADAAKSVDVAAFKDRVRQLFDQGDGSANRMRGRG